MQTPDVRADKTANATHLQDFLVVIRDEIDLALYHLKNLVY
jgi:hypothetical protein